MSHTRHILGVDLAWGERHPDGVCALETTRDAARISDVSRSFRVPSRLQAGAPATARPATARSADMVSALPR